MLGGRFARLSCRYNPFRFASGEKWGNRAFMHSAHLHNMPHSSGTRYGTTILCVRKGDKVVLMGDGQVTQNSMCVKPNARKLRTLAGNKVITGFAGATADAFTLFERLETKLEEYPGQLLRACVELAKMWRTDRYLKNLEALMIVADENISLEVSGNGDVLESHDGVIAVGSGGGYALAAARALYDVGGLTARDIAQKSMQVAADLCIYTNHHFTTLELSSNVEAASPTDKTPLPPSLPPTLFEPNLPKPIQ